MFGFLLVKALREEARRQMPEGAEKHSPHWYLHGGGEEQCRVATLMRSAADYIEAEL